MLRDAWPCAGRADQDVAGFSAGWRHARHSEEVLGPTCATFCLGLSVMAPLCASLLDRELAK